MTDRDVMERAAKLLGVNVVAEKSRGVGLKPLYSFQVNGRRAAGLMMTLFSFLGRRRRDKIKEVLVAWPGPQKSFAYTVAKPCGHKRVCGCK